MGRNERIYEEAAELWRTLRGEPPPQADGPTMLDWLLGDLPEPSYDRLETPHLRAANIVLPKR